MPNGAMRVLGWKVEYKSKAQSTFKKAYEYSPLPHDDDNEAPTIN